MKLKYFRCGFILLGLLLIIGISQAAAATTNTNQQISIHDAHAYPNPFDNEKEVTKIKFKVRAEKKINDVSIAVIVYDFNGKKVWTKRVANAGFAKGYTPIEVLWGGDNDMGERVANGLYFAKIIVEASNTKVKVVKILVK